MPAMDVDFGPPEEVGAKWKLHSNPMYHTTEDWGINPIVGGMQGGRTSLMVKIPFFVERNDPTMPRQRINLLAETSLKIFLQTAQLLRAKFEEEIEAEGIGFSYASPALMEQLGQFYRQIISQAIPEATEEQLDECVNNLGAFNQAGAPQSTKDIVDLLPYREDLDG